MRNRRAATAFAVALVASLTLACQGGDSPDASASPVGPGQSGQPVSARVVRDQVSITLSLERDRSPAGAPLRARVEIVNLGLGPVSWQSGGCGLLNGFRLEGPDVAQPPAGRAWEGTAHWAKWSATTGGIAIPGFLDPRALQRGFMMACPADLRVDDIAAGATAEVEAVWPGVISDGQPAPAGEYRLSYSFPFLGRVAKEQFRGDAINDAKPMAVEVRYVVEGGASVAVPSTLAFDAALGDMRVAHWINGIAREELNGASIRLEDGLWRIRIETQRETAAVAVDPSTGLVLTVEIQ